MPASKANDVVVLARSPYVSRCFDIFQDVTQDFCKWVAGLGGESNNIEESTIYSLFASG